MTNKKSKPKTEATVPPLLLSVFEALDQAGAFDQGGTCGHWLENENLDLLAAWIAKDFGLDGVRLWFNQRWKGEELHPDGEPLQYRTCELLEDTARKLDGKGLPHVGDVLRKIAEDLPSECEEIIEKGGEEEYYRRHGPNAAHQRKTHLLITWVMKRIPISGRSWNQIVRRYGLDDGWLDLKGKDLVCEDGRWRYLPMADNGQKAPLNGGSRH
jgi:hypothetical protein